MVNIIAFINYHPLDATIMGLGLALIAYAAYIHHYQGLPMEQAKYYAVAGALLVLLALFLYYGMGI